MKKRKPPVVLATCLVLMLVAVGIIYSPKGGGDGHDHGPESAPPPAAEQGERPKMTPQQVSAMSSQKAKAAPGPAGPKMMGAGEEGSGPSISMPKQTPYKPTPNESSTSTQWYTNETKR